METSSISARGFPEIELGELIEHQKFGRFALVLLAMSSITMFLEGLTMQLVGYAAPEMIKTLGVDKIAFGAIFGVGNSGVILGALLFGGLGDRLGRRRLIVAGVFLFSFFTLVTSYGTSLTELCVLRFIAGLGLGGALPNAISLTAEYAPHGRRATRISLLYVAYNIGGAVAGLIASRAMPVHGWPIVFAICGGIGLSMGILLWLFLPESARFLAQRKPDGSALRQIVARLRPDQPLSPDAKIVLNEEPPRPVKVAALFHGGRAPMTLLLWTAYIGSMTTLQFMTSWLPTVVAGAEIDVSVAVLAGSVLLVSGTFGSVVVAWLTDRKGVIAIAISFSIAAPFVAFLGPATAAVPTLMLAVAFAGFFLIGSQNGLNATAGMVYPTWMRSTGAGWTTGIGRIGSIIGPVLGGFLISLDIPISSVFLCVAAPLMVTAGTVALLSRCRALPPIALRPASPP